MKYYAVKNGRKAGIYNSWAECEKHIKGYPNATFKSFPSKEEAVLYLNQKEDKTIYKTYAYTDGSYDAFSDIVGYASVLYRGNKRYLLQGRMNNTYRINNIAGELQAVIETVKYCIELGEKELTIFHDYLGIDMWATGKWEANTVPTCEYKKFMDGVKNQISVSFIKVKSHSGDGKNDEVDYYAKEAINSPIEKNWSELYES